MASPAPDDFTWNLYRVRQFIVPYASVANENRPPRVNVVATGDAERAFQERMERSSATEASQHVNS